MKERLLQMIKDDGDYLIAETLVKLNSVEATNHMEIWLNKASSPAVRIKWASFITEIRNGDLKMEAIAYQEFQNFKFKYEVESIIFYDLIKFQSDRINDLIRNYIDHKYFLVSLHAKRALGLDDE
ncbi:hypothetical protein SAMN06265375_1131 [Muriicola jejuensis]|nr:hypothetical protein SAMN06265375_1131 [Muriicola jejuensis]